MQQVVMDYIGFVGFGCEFDVGVGFKDIVLGGFVGFRDIDFGLIGVWMLG